MAKVGSLVVDLALESAKFISGLKQAQAATVQTATSISSAMNFAKTAAVGFAGALSVDMFLGQVQAAFDYGDAIVDLADRTGATTKTIQELRYAAQMSGSGIESADAALDKFAKNLGAAQNGNKAMAKTFADLGVTSSDTDTALRQTMAGISKLGNVTQQNQKSTELFGKSAADLTVLLSGGASGYDELAAAARTYGLVIDDAVLRNGGQVNDQLDTMKMILNAQMASMIIQNADALMQLANGFMAVTSAIVQMNQQMDVKRLMSLQQGNPLKWDIPKIVSGRLQGKSTEEVRSEARDELKTTTAGRQALFRRNAQVYNEKRRSGVSKDDSFLKTLLHENAEMQAAQNAANKAVKPPAVNTPNLRVPSTPKSKTKHETPQKSDEELQRQWDRALLGAQSDLYGAQANLTNEPTERAELEGHQLRDRHFMAVADIDADTGSDAEVREGKKRYTEAQATQLKQIEQEIFGADFDRTMRDRDEEIARERLDMSESLLRTDADKLSAEMSLARSTRDRRDLALKMLDNQFAQERLQLEAIKASATATAAEKAIAEARLKALPALQALAQEGARKQNQSPMEAYLDAIPQTKGEIDDALESVEVEGLKSLQDGLKGIIDGTKSVGEAFSSMADTIISQLINIALQQAIIKPLADMLMGIGSSVITGLFGAPVVGARANGGFTAPGTYLTGERGPELVTIGSNAHVTANRALRGASNDNGGGGVHVTFGSITSNDPEKVRALALEAISQALPMIRQQSYDFTVSKLRRPGLS